MKTLQNETFSSGECVECKKCRHGCAWISTFSKKCKECQSDNTKHQGTGNFSENKTILKILNKKLNFSIFLLVLSNLSSESILTPEQTIMLCWWG